jgi:hypothetical protein
MQGNLSIIYWAQQRDALLDAVEAQTTEEIVEPAEVIAA